MAVMQILIKVSANIEIENDWSVLYLSTINGITI